MRDKAIQSDNSVNKKEHKNLEKYQRLKGELEKMWGIKTTVVPVSSDDCSTGSCDPQAEYSI